MEKLILKLQKYFTGALCSGDYTVSDLHPGYLTATVDGKYKFTIWYGSGDPHYLSTASVYGFMQLPPFTDEQKRDIWRDIQIHLSVNKERIRDERLAQLRAEIETLERQEVKGG